MFSTFRRYLELPEDPSIVAHPEAHNRLCAFLDGNSKRRNQTEDEM
jgi:hypothetical protein